MITYNRLEYTRQALDALIDSDVDIIFIWDNDSTDGTTEYLQNMSNRFHKIVTVINSDYNVGIAPAMNWYLYMTTDYEYIAKVDNDTIVPPDFCKRMWPHLAKADIVQAKHHIIPATCKGGWPEFTRNMPKEGNTFFHSFVGGSGILARRKVLSELPATEWKLYSWNAWQKAHPKVIKAFAEDVEIELLDQNGYHDYPEYYKETKRL